MRWDHPHAYGDKKVVGNIYDNPEGSSPRVWGQEFTMLYKDNNMGIIPTRMGTSNRDFVTVCVYQDHPHAYGDKCVTQSHDTNNVGSSPRVWGQGAGKSTLKSVSRIIPTRMGTSLRQIHAKICVKDHPHAYGDKKLSYRFHKKGVGSSPRVWGQEQEHAQHLCLLWIIPTRMGTSRAVQREECAG